MDTQIIIVSLVSISYERLIISITMEKNFELMQIKVA